MSKIIGCMIGKPSKCIMPMVLFMLLSVVVSWAQTGTSLQVQGCNEGGRHWNADSLVHNVMLGQGVQVSNVRFNNSVGNITSNAIGTFRNGLNAGLGIDSGFVITTGRLSDIPGPVLERDVRSQSPTPASTMYDHDLWTIDTTQNLYDCSVLEFDFVSQSDSVVFHYVFASEEYPEYVCCSYNDRFGFFLTRYGTNDSIIDSTRNIALLPVSQLPVSINNINGGLDGSNCSRHPSANCHTNNDGYFVVNDTLWMNDEAYNPTIAFDGYTTVLTASAIVVPCVTYHLKLCIADVRDNTHDSGVFIEANSLSAQSLTSYTREDNSPSQGDLYETCCMDLIVKRLRQHTSDTLVIYQSNITTSSGDYSITPAVSSSADNLSRFEFPVGVDSLVFHICGTRDEVYEAMERFKLTFKLTRDCFYSERYFDIVNVEPMQMTILTPDLSGTPVSLNGVVLGGAPPFIYEWEDLNSNTITRDTSNERSHSISVPLDPLRQFRLCVTDGCGSELCGYVAIGSTPIFIDTQQVQTTICYNSSTTLTCPILPSTTGTVHYTWYNGTTTSHPAGCSSSSFTPPNLTWARTYTVVATYDSLGTTWSNVKRFDIAIENLPSLTFTYTDPDPDVVSRGSSTFQINVCNGDSVHLVVSSDDAVTYQWPGDSTFSAHTHYALLPTQAALNNTANTSLTVSAQGPAPRYCTNSRSINITTHPYPVANLSATRVDTCEGSTVTLTASGISSSHAIYYYGWNTSYPTTRYYGGNMTKRCNNLRQNDTVLLTLGSSNRLCLTTYIIPIVVHPVVFDFSLSADSICRGDTLVLTAHGADQYHWPGTSANSYTSDSIFRYVPATSGNISFSVGGRNLHPVCVKNLQDTVKVIPLPQLSLTPTHDTICVGDSITLSASASTTGPATRYRWQGSTSFAPQGSTTVLPDSSGYIRVQAYNRMEQCSVTDSAWVSVLPYPVVTVTADVDSVCAGESTTLRLSGAAEYSLNDTLHFTTATTRTVTPTGTGTTYTVYGRAAQRICISSATIRVGVMQLPTVTLTSTDTNLCQGQHTTLAATGGGSYNWYSGGGDTPQASHDSILVVSPTATTTYTVEGITSGYSPCSSRRSININVFNYPSLTPVPDTSVCTGNSIMLRACPQSVQGVTYWYSQADSSASAPSSMGCWTDVTPVVSQDYYIHASAGPANLCQTHDTIHVNLWPLPTLTTAATPEQVCSGESVSLTARGAESYVWTKNGVIVGTRDTITDSNGNANTHDTTGADITYTLTGTDSNQCVNATSQVVRVHNIPTPTLTVAQESVCVGSTTTLTATDAYYLSWDSTTWQNMSTIIEDTLDREGDTTIEVWGYTSLPRCNHKSIVSVSVLPYPVVIVTADADSVCMGDSTTLHLHGAAEYSIGDTLHFTSDTTCTVAPTGTGTTYTIYGRTARHICISSDTIRIGVMQLPTVSLTPSATNICQGQSDTLVATGGSTYNWYVDSSSTPLMQHGDTILVSPITSTTYAVEGVTSGYSPCSSRRSISITVFEYPVLIPVPDTSVCGGNTFALRANPRQSTGTTYWYTLQGVAERRGQGDMGYWTNLSTSTDTSYLIYASTGPDHLCQRHDSVRVHLWTLPEVVASVQPQDACSNEDFSLTATGATTYNWQLEGNQISTGATLTTRQANSATAPRIVAYTLLGTDTNGCQNHDTIEVTIHSLPVLTMQAAPALLCAGNTVTLTADGAQHLSWDSIQWGDSISASTTHRLDTARTETFRVWGYNSLQRCNTQQSASVNVLAYPAFSLTADEDSVCIGASTNIRANGNAFEYSLGDTLHFSSTAVFPVTPTGTGTTYIVYGRNAQQMCVSSDTIRIGVLPLPALTLEASDTIICQGDSVLLTAANSQSYHWHLQGSSQPMDADSSATRYVMPASTTTYEVEGSNTEGTVRCSSSRQITITVYQRPTLRVMDDTAICQNQQLNLCAFASSVTPPIRYSFWGAGQQGIVSSEETSSQAGWFPSTQQAGVRTYVMSASTGSDSLCRAVDTVHVIVWALPTVTLRPDSREYCQDDTVTLQAGGASRYSWTTATAAYLVADTQQLTPTVGSHTYTVYGEDQHGCRNSDTARITIYDYPTTQLVSDYYDICHGGNVLLTASGAQHYSWDGGSTWVNANPSTHTGTTILSLSDSATIYVEGYNGSRLCQVRDSVRVCVYSYPAMTLAADTDQICHHDTVHLAATGAYQYSFDQGNTWGSDSTFSPVPATAGNHTYSVWGRSEGPGCTSQLAQAIQVHPLPNLQMSVSQDAFCADTVIDINATGGDYYRLYTDTSRLLPLYDTIHAWQRLPEASTIYTVDCLTQHNCFATASHAVTVWSGRFQLFCEDTVVCEHGQVAVSAQGMREYFWNGSTVPDTHNVYIFTVDSASDFTVYGRDSHGCHGEETMHVDVYPNPHLQLAADTLGACVGDTVNILASGASEYIYHWVSTASRVDSSYTAQVLDTTWYVVTGIEGNLRCSSTDSIQIVAYPLPPVVLTPDRHEVCDGDTVHLTASGANRYAWTDSSNYDTHPFYSNRPYRDTLFILWGEEDTYHCRNYDTAVVHWFGHPALTIQPDRYNICEGDSAVITYSGASFYEWADTEGISTRGSRNVRPDTTTTYYLHGDLRNPYFCGSDTSITIQVFPIPDVQIHASDTALCYGDTVHLMGSGATYYAWLDDTNHRSIDSISQVVYRSTTFHLSGTIPNRLCYHNDSIHVTVYDPHVKLTPQAWEICNGASMEIMASGSDRYRWEAGEDFTDSNTHTFTFHSNSATSTQQFLHIEGETANHLCQADTTIAIVVYPGPNIHLTIENRDSIAPRTWEICAGDTVDFLARGGYYYKFPQQMTAARPVRHKYVPPHEENDTSWYYLYGENFNHQCNGWDSVTIIVNALPVVDVTANRMEMCVGDSLHLTATGAEQYNWMQGNQFTPDSTLSIIADSTANYIVYGLDAKGCRNFDTISVTVYSLPVVRLTATADTLCQGMSTTVTATGAFHYAWGEENTFGTTDQITIQPLHDTIIYVRGNNFNGLCITGDSIRITVLTPPTVTIVADKEVVCLGDTVTVTTQCSEPAWAWEQEPFGHAPWVLTPQDSTWVHVTTLAANGCYAYDSLLVQVRPFHHVQLHGDEHLCLDESVTVQASGSDVYSWDGGQNFVTDNQLTISPTADTTIRVQGSVRDTICQVADTLHISVHVPQPLYVDPETTTVCLGDSIIISASGCEQYRWMEETVFGWHNGYHVYTPSAAGTLQYVVTGMQYNGVCTVSAPVVMNVQDTAHILFACDTDICLGDSVRIHTTGADRYAWNDNAQYSDTIGYYATLPTRIGTYTYPVRGQAGTQQCVGSSSVRIEVHSVPQVSLFANRDTTCSGDTVTLTATGGYHYMWLPDSTCTPQAVHPYHPLVSTDYSVIGIDSLHLCVDTAMYHIHVNPLPHVAVVADTTQICWGDMVTLTATGATNYAWDGGATTPQYTHSYVPLDDTLGIVIGTDTNGCKVSDTIRMVMHTPFTPYILDSTHVIVHLYPTVTITTDRPNGICHDSTDRVTLTAHGAESYLWTDVAEETDSILQDMPDSTRYYTVVGAMHYGCPDTAQIQVTLYHYPPLQFATSDTALCDSSTFTLTATGADLYSWDGGNTFVTDTSRQILQPVGTTQYVVIGANATRLCQVSDTLAVTVYPYPSMHIAGATRWCEGSEVTLTVENPADTLHWTAVPADESLVGQDSNVAIHVHPDVNTVYSVLGISHMCASQVHHEVQRVAYPDLIVEGSEPRICIIDSVILSAEGADLYSWDEGQSYTMDSSIVAYPQESGFHRIIGTTYDTLCSVMDSVYVQVDTIPIMSISGPDSSCIGRYITLWAHSQVPIKWSSQPHDVELDIQDTAMSVRVGPHPNTIYSITGYSGMCQGSASHMVTTGTIPTAAAAIHPTRVHRADDTQITLYNLSTDGYGGHWIFPDSTYRYGQTYTFMVPLNYEHDTFPVTLVIYRGGCHDTTSVRLIVENDEVGIPNIFTPDLLTNNRFKVVVNNKKDFRLVIYNRRGQKLYESTDPNEGWDGTYEGKPCPMASYVYHVRMAPKYSDEVKDYTGTVTLIR